MTAGLVRDDPTEVDDLFVGISIIDCDSHFTEPPTLWSDRAPAAWKGRLPEQRTVNGRTAWFLNDELWASTGGNTVRRGREKVLGTLAVQPFEDIDRSAWDPAERLRWMDENGIYAQVLYPNGVGFSSNHIFAVDDLVQRQTVLTTYNDFLVDLQAESGGRLLPQAMLPIWDMDLTVKEATRLLDKGIRGFTLSDRPELLGLPELPHRYFDPMWDLLNQARAVTNFHIGSGYRKEDLEALRGSRAADDEDPGGARATPPAVADLFWRSFGDQRRMVARSCQGFMSNVRIIVNLCLSNLFDRYENLSIVSAESGIGWLPFILEALEFQFDETITDPTELALQQRRPTEYFRDHIYAMFWFEKVAPRKLLEDIGIDNVLVETDYPHPTCLYPGTRERLAAVTRDLPRDVLRRIMQDNAARIYRISPPTA
jgi:uncharacterized protein